MPKVRRVVAISPAWNETVEMFQAFNAQMGALEKELATEGVAFKHYFLSDASPTLPPEIYPLIVHQENQGLAWTLVDGYTAVLQMPVLPDVVIRLDSQEHDAATIRALLETFAHTNIQACFAPVWYWVKGQPRLPMTTIYRFLADFRNALNPINREAVLQVYNQKFPMGFQAFRIELLLELLPLLKRAVEEIIPKKISGPATWALDLLAILLAAKLAPEAIDFYFAGFAKPWQENRPVGKIRQQQERAAVMVEVAQELGCKVSE